MRENEHTSVCVCVGVAIFQPQHDCPHGALWWLNLNAVQPLAWRRNSLFECVQTLVKNSKARLPLQRRPPPTLRWCIDPLPHPPCNSAGRFGQPSLWLFLLQHFSWWRVIGFWCHHLRTMKCLSLSGCSSPWSPFYCCNVRGNLDLWGLLAGSSTFFSPRKDVRF